MCRLLFFVVELSTTPESNSGACSRLSGPLGPSETKRLTRRFVTSDLGVVAQPTWRMQSPSLPSLGSPVSRVLVAVARPEEK